MTSHQTIVVELGSSRIKVGFAGESKPRRVLNRNCNSTSDGCTTTWTVDDVNDGMISGVCKWPSFYHYASLSTLIPSAPRTNTIVRSTTLGVYEWEKTMYPLFSHILTSILFIQRPSRHRILLLINDFFPPRTFTEALHRVLLDYLNVGSVWLLHGGVYEGLYHLLQGMPAPSIPSTVRTQAQAHLIVDIGTYEARVVASVEGSSTLADTYQTTDSGYQSFLCRVLSNYEEMDDESVHTKTKRPIISTLDDADAIVQSWIALSSSSSFDTLPETNTISVSVGQASRTPQRQTESETDSTIQVSTQPLLDAFHEIYLNYTNPSSLTYAILTCVMKCPIDYRRPALQNTILLGGGAVALRAFRMPRDSKSVENSCHGFGRQLEISIKDACGAGREESNGDAEEEEKKDSDAYNLSPIAQQHFRSLRGAVNGCAKPMGGINVRYPDPFAADLAAWIGGSVLGTMGYTQYQKKSL